MTRARFLVRPLVSRLAGVALVVGTVGLVACVFADSSGEEAAVASRPNFVVFLVDDLRFDKLGFAGHPFVETPHIDRLAHEGVSFTNAFVTTSLCCPSRASLLTGLYAHQHGVTSNLGIELDEDLPTFPKLLRAAGWETAFIGKWHMGSGADPRPGFDHWVSFDGQGHYFDPRINENGVEAIVEGYVTDILTDRAVAWIESRADGEPFCLFLSHKATHAPMAPAARHRGRYAESPVVVPASVHDDLAGKPEALRRGAAHGFGTMDIERRANDPVPDRVPAPEWEMRDFVRAYLETTLSVDDSVGRVLSVLDENDLTANTIVLFASDNGYAFGEHQAPDKRLAWEESIHVPFVVYAPGRVPPGTNDDIVLNIDVAPTLMRWAGIENAAEMSGRSFAHLIDPSIASEGDQQPVWRDHFFYSYFREKTLAGIPTVLGIRSKAWKYVQYPDSLAPNEELYRIDTDPGEATNLAAEPDVAGVLAEMRTKLADAMAATRYSVPAHAREPSFDPIDAPAPVTIPLGDDMRLPENALKSRAFTLRVRTRIADGLVLSGGRKGNGFRLSVEDGRPLFEVVARRRKRRVVGPELGEAASEPIRIEAGLGGDGRVFLRVDGTETRAALAMNAPMTTGNALTIGAEYADLIENVEWIETGKQR